MALKSYLKPENAGSQLWQMLTSNLTRGDHPFNFGGMCMAMVAQWLLEIELEQDQTPAQLGRYLLTGWLGKHGYGGLTKSQTTYGRQNLDPNIPDLPDIYDDPADPTVNDIHSKMVRRHTGGMLMREKPIHVGSHSDHWNKMRVGIYNCADNGAIQLHDRSQVYSAHISLRGTHSGLAAWLGGAEWGHAIGLHSDQNRVYFFDPNYGVFVFEQDRQGTISNFIKDLWAEYSATNGSVADVHTPD